MKTEPRTERLTPILCRALVKMSKANSIDIHLGKCDLEFSERANAPKLQYFGLIVPSPVLRHWQITQLGYNFLDGKAVIRYVKVINNMPKLFRPERATISEILQTEQDCLQKKDYQPATNQVELF